MILTHRRGHAPMFRLFVHCLWVSKNDWNRPEAPVRAWAINNALNRAVDQKVKLNNPTLGAP